MCCKQSRVISTAELIQYRLPLPAVPPLTWMLQMISMLSSAVLFMCERRKSWRKSKFPSLAPEEMYENDYSEPSNYTAKISLVFKFMRNLLTWFITSVTIFLNVDGLICVFKVFCSCYFSFKINNHCGITFDLLIQLLIQQISHSALIPFSPDQRKSDHLFSPRPLWRCSQL